MYGSITSPDDLMLLLHRFQAMTIFQIVRLLRKETTVNNIRSKLKRLVDGGFIETQFLPRATPWGSSPMLYSLSSKGIRYVEGLGVVSSRSQKIKGVLPLAHLQDINDVLIASLLLPVFAPSISVFEYRHEKVFKQTPIRVGDGSFLCPDGFTHFLLSPPYGRTSDEPMGIIWEVDRNTEDAFTIREKVRDYLRLFYDDFEQIFGTSCLSVAFVITQGGDTRVKQLVRAIEQELKSSPEYGEQFLFSSVSPTNTSPLHFFTFPLWAQPFQSSPVSLIESPS